jgi:hypothetical protein
MIWKALMIFYGIGFFVIVLPRYLMDDDGVPFHVFIIFHAIFLLFMWGMMKFLDWISAEFSYIFGGKKEKKDDTDE